MHIHKDPLPKGYSFVLRSSQLERAFEAAGIRTETSLWHTSSNSFVIARFVLPNPNVAHERFHVSAGIVPAARARETRERLETTVIPQLIAWANSVLGLPANSTRRDKQRFEVDLSSL
ncbi:hypothetical protein [Roseateles sp. P5_E11]